MPSGGSKIKKVDPLVPILLERTEKWGKGYGMYLKGKEPKTKITKTAMEVDKVIKGAKFGCQEPAVRSICNILLKRLGESALPKRKSETMTVAFMPATVLVPTSGDYIGEPSLLLNKTGRIVATDGSHIREGSFTMDASNLRLAEQVEIEHLVSILRKRYPEKHDMITLIVEAF